MTAKIKVSEIFYSIQGEGRYQGVPSVFLRTFGCNFSCKNFGRDSKNVPENETHNPEVADVISKISLYKNYKELPLVSTGCDSYAAVYPEFKHLSPIMTIDEVASQIVNLLPNKSWKSEHLVITGGEPLLGWQRVYKDLLDHQLMVNLSELTFETNGSQKLRPELAEYLKEWRSQFGRTYNSVTFSVSPKLSCSGESRRDAIKPDLIYEMQQVGYTYLKFVVANETDVNEALEAVKAYQTHSFTGPVYLMPIGGEESVYKLNNQTVAELALKHGLRYSDRLQVPLFKNQWGT